MPEENVFPALAGVKNIIAVSSCKGGVGKSTVAFQLALEAARRDLRVGLADCDIHGPSMPTLFNLQHHKIATNEVNRLVPAEKFNVKLMSFGFLLGDAPAVMRGPIVTRYIQQVLLNTEWGKLDYLFLDMPPGTGDVQLTITQLLRLTGAVIVTTPQTLSLVDVARGILMFEKVNVPILGLVNNMAYFICDACDKKHFLFGELNKEQIQKRFGIETVTEIPFAPPAISETENAAQNPCFKDALDKLLRAAEEAKDKNLNEVPLVYADENTITLKWHDSRQWVVENHALRANCQCALCVNEMTGKKTLSDERIKKDIAATKIVPLGNYALGIEWNDGHTSGIYSYPLIEELAVKKSGNVAV